MWGFEIESHIETSQLIAVRHRENQWESDRSPQKTRPSEAIETGALELTIVERVPKLQDGYWLGHRRWEGVDPDQEKAFVGTSKRIKNKEAWTFEILGSDHINVSLRLQTSFGVNWIDWELFQVCVTTEERIENVILFAPNTRLQSDRYLFCKLW